MSEENVAAEQVAERLESTRALGNKYVRFSLSEADELLTALRHQSTGVTEITGADIDRCAHALEDGTDLTLRWEDFCIISELVLRAYHGMSAQERG